MEMKLKEMDCLRAFTKLVVFVSLKLIVGSFLCAPMKMSESSRPNVASSVLARFLKRFPKDDRVDASDLVTSIGLQQVLNELDSGGEISNNSPQQLLARMRGIVSEAPQVSIQRKPSSRLGSFRHHGASGTRLRIPSMRKGQDGSSSKMAVGGAGGGAQPAMDDIGLGALVRTVPCPSDDEPEALTPPSPMSANPLSLMSEDDRIVGARVHSQRQHQQEHVKSGFAPSGLAFIVATYLDEVIANSAAVSLQPTQHQQGKCLDASSSQVIFPMAFLSVLRDRIAADRGARRDILVLSAQLPAVWRHLVVAPAFDDLYRSFLISYHLEAR